MASLVFGMKMKLQLVMSLYRLSFQPSFTSQHSSVTSGSCSSTSDSVTMTTWCIGKTLRSTARSPSAACFLQVRCLLGLQGETLSTTTPGENPPRTTIAMATRVTQIRASGSESSTT